MNQFLNTGIVSEVPLGAGIAAAGATAAGATVADVPAETTQAASARDASAQTPDAQNATTQTNVIQDNSHCQDVPRGVFITFEGGEGAGKSTHIRFLASVLADAGREVVRLREPGGTTLGEQLRAVVLNPENAQLSDTCELLIYEAARAQLVAEVIKPALERGAVVLSDRFYDSTVAYQGFGRGLDRTFIDAANAFACQGTTPDRTILLVAPSAEEGLERATRHSGADRIEAAGAPFHSRVNSAFLEIAQGDSDRIRVIHSSGKKSDTARAIFAELEDLFPWMSSFVAQNAERFSHLDVERIHEGQN